MTKKTFNYVTIGLVVMAGLMAIPILMPHFLITYHLDLCIQMMSIEKKFLFPLFFMTATFLELAIITTLANQKFGNGRRINPKRPNTNR
jgi:hypothetical protein